MDRQAPRLDSVTIKGFKSIKALEKFDLKNINILIGANGAGKSNFIDFFKLLNRMIDNRFQLYVKEEGGADNILHFGQKNTSEIGIELYFYKNQYNAILSPAMPDKLFFKDETFYYWEKELYNRPHETFYPTPHDESVMSDYITSNRRGVPGYTYDVIKNWVVYHINDTSISAKLRKTAEINNNRFLQPDASNLAAYLYLLKRNYSFNYNKIVESVRLVAPFFEDFILEPARENPNTIQLEWRHIGTTQYFNSHSISDGTLRFICLATVLLQPDPPSLILLDEPELGLHPSAIHILAELIKSVSINSQVIATTQSVTMLNQFEPEDIVVIDRKDEQSVFSRRDRDSLKNWLEDYSLGDLWEKNVLGGRP